MKKNYDVVVAGGGIIGGSIAFELARSGARVLLLDRQQPGLEASWAAAGMLAPAPESPEAAALVPLARASFALYPQYIAAIEEASGKRTGFHLAPAIHAFFGAEADADRRAMLRMLAQCGLEAEETPMDDALRLEPQLSPAARAVALLRAEGHVDNRALTEAVLAAAMASGVVIRGGTTVTSLLVGKNQCTGVVAGEEKISAGCVVIAAGCYSGSIEGAARYAPTRPARGQMVALRPGGAGIRHVLRSHRGYVVPRDDGRIVAGSTIENAGFEKRVTPAGLQQILSAAVELAPSLETAPVAETWSGLRPDTPDHLPILGPTDIAGLVMATGHFRNGILLAPVTARLVREWIAKEKPSVGAEGFSPLRFLEKKRGAVR